MKVNFTISANNITLFYKKAVFNIPSTFKRFSELKEHLKQAVHDIDFIESIVNVPKEIERASNGNVKIIGNLVYYKNEPVRDVLTEKLLSLLDEGFDITPWTNFMNKIMENPSKESRESLFGFLEVHNTPITEDGDFIAFKRVRTDWYDIHSGSILNKPGMTIEMPREQVNHNNNETCSSGLHVAASIYLNNFASAQNSKTIVCKVNPKDVCAVPKDYNNSKMRTCKYVVLDEVEVGSIKDIEKQVVHPTPNVADLAQEIFDYYSPENAKDVDIDTSKDYDVDYVKPKSNSVIKTQEYDANGLVFTSSDGKRFTQKDVVDGVKQSGGVTSWAKNNNIPRSTAQGWVKKILNSPAQTVVATPVVPVDPLEKIHFSNSKGENFTAREIIDGVKKMGGVTAWAKSVNQARSTVQGWVKKIYNG